VVCEENALNYIRARYYSTSRGRFVTKDPVKGRDGDSQSLNRYIYALNNPVGLIDISGFSATEADGAASDVRGSSDDSAFHKYLLEPSFSTATLPDAVDNSRLVADRPGGLNLTASVFGSLSTFGLKAYDAVNGTFLAPTAEIFSKIKGIVGFASRAKKALKEIPERTHRKIECLTSIDCDISGFQREGDLLFYDLRDNAAVPLIKSGLEITGGPP
jgi:RHS repeat-associated protein